MKKISFNKKWIGLFLIILALLFIPITIVVPFMSFSVGIKTAIIATCIVLGQILTWIGVFLLGKELYVKYKKQLNPFKWFNKKDSEKK